MLTTRETTETVINVPVYFLQGDVWICMEVMDMSLDKFYKMLYGNEQMVPEDILGKIAVAVSLFLLLLVRSTA